LSTVRQAPYTFRGKEGIISHPKPRAVSSITRHEPGNVTRFAKVPQAPVPGTLLSWILRLIDFLDHQSELRVVIMAAIGIAAIAELDILTGEVSTSIFYLIPISIATWRLGRMAGTALSFLCAFLWGAVELSTHVFSHPGIPVWNAVVRLGFFLIVTHSLSAMAVMQEWVRSDYLTGLANKRGFYEFANNELHRARRRSSSFTLAYIDIDNFKRVNDKWGHSAGDSVLQLFGTILRGATRRSDVVARIGGDEFAVLLSDTNYDSSARALEKLRDALNRGLKEHNWAVTFSTGAATFQNWPNSIDAALDQADRLMYEIKALGKDAVMHRAVTVRSTQNA